MGDLEAALFLEKDFMLGNPFGKSLQFPPKEPKEPEVTSLEDPKVPVSLVPIPKVENVEESEHAKILREHGYLESNIPIHHHYWRIRP